MLVRNSSASLGCPVYPTEVCARCRQVSHDGACDESRQSEEDALLAKFKLRKCFRCGQAMKKMFGCAHMICRCGAHFCWDPGVDLDAGGARRWALEDFGDEAAEEPVFQVWSCSHEFRGYESSQSGIYHGNLALMECNRCLRRSSRENSALLDRAMLQRPSARS